ncbi:MAG: sensor domain-containing diguanylate cyclase [Desulfobacteraceae bacterium]
MAEETKWNYKEMLDNLYDGVYFVDPDRRIQYWNRAAERITGFEAGEVVGRSCSDNILMHVDEEGKSLCHGDCPLAATLRDGKPRGVDVFLHHRNGHRLPIAIRVTPLRDGTGNLIGAVEVFSDISDKMACFFRVQELEKLAMLDALTQLPNRVYLEQELRSRIEEYERYDLVSGVLFMDIDHFKHFNDTYGHDLGDEVLKTLGATLLHNSRLFDLFGRWGGEEFLGIVRNVDAEGLERVGKRSRTMIRASRVRRQAENLQVTVSIGGTLLKEGDTVDSVVRRADALMYQSKKDGRDRFTIG